MRLLLRPALARLAFFTAAVAVMVIANLPDPPQLPGQWSDKEQHILAFVMLAALARVAWPLAATWEIMIFLGAFGALIELVQAAAAMGRDPSLADWLADCAAIALCLIIITAIKLLARKSRNTSMVSGPIK